MPRTGRPPKLDLIIAHEAHPDTGADQPVTIADRILQALTAGTPEAGAAASVGLSVTALRDWRTEGNRLNQQLAAGTLNRSHLSHHQRRLADFAVEATRAIGEWEVRSNTILESLAAGGLVVETVTRKTMMVEGAEVETERTVRKETLLPDRQVLQWRLARRFPDRYSERREITGKDGEPIPVEIRVGKILEGFAQFGSADPDPDDTEELLEG